MELGRAAVTGEIEQERKDGWIPRLQERQTWQMPMWPMKKLGGNRHWAPTKTSKQCVMVAWRDDVQGWLTWWELAQYIKTLEGAGEQTPHQNNQNVHHGSALHLEWHHDHDSKCEESSQQGGWWQTEARILARIKVPSLWLKFFNLAPFHLSKHIVIDWNIYDMIIDSNIDSIKYSMTQTLEAWR